ncbi:hypothetical protein AB0H51_25180 [Streptomyces griseoluteus]|uniref:hypothetical protein n=1 Tax=Streptomyces griseoluteus TaxID=29306 RepID=UPI0034083141
MRVRATTAAVTAALAITLVGCSSGGEPEKVQVTVTQTAGSGNTTPTGEPTTENDAKAAGVARMQAVQKFNDPGDDEYDPTAGTVTVLSYQQPVRASVTAAEEIGTKGYVWAALEVKVCSTKGEFVTSSQPWTLAYDDGARVEPSSSTYDDFPKPEYVEDADVSPGDCSRGKIVYPVPGDKWPAKAIYATDSSPALRWSLAK